LRHAGIWVGVTALVLAAGLLPLHSEWSGAAAMASEEPSKDVFEAAYNMGRSSFSSNCASCHGANGEGDAGPSLVGNELLAEVDVVTETIIHGYSYMPPFGDMLTDAQVAAIATYIRNSWGNEYGFVAPEDAEAAR
jgi:Cytochrome c, mono- and diheme variants